MDYKIKYLKYKNKYLSLKMYGGSPFLDRVKSYFAGKDICTKDDLFISDFKSLTPSTGATIGYGGALVYYGNINTPEGMIPVVVKFFSLIANRPTGAKDKTDKGVNEIGLTHYISNHFLKPENKKLTNNFTTFYYNIKCSDYILKTFEQSKALLSGTRQTTEPIINNDSNIMIVEKLSGDLKGYIKAKIGNPNLFKIVISILIQIALTLIIFNKEFKFFSHGDFHSGNILLLIDPAINIKKIRYTSQFFDYKINLNTYNIIPKIWDFATSNLKVINDQFKKDIKPSPFFDYLGTVKPLIHTQDAGYETGITNDVRYLFSSILLDLKTAASEKSIPNINTSPLYVLLEKLNVTDTVPSKEPGFRNVSHLLDQLIEELIEIDSNAVYSWFLDEEPDKTQEANIADAEFIFNINK